MPTKEGSIGEIFLLTTLILFGIYKNRYGKSLEIISKIS
jgi:hypothetical protein